MQDAFDACEPEQTSAVLRVERMVESVVNFLVEKLFTLADQDVELLNSVSNEIRNIGEEFKSIKVLLRSADEKVDTDDGVKEWVEQVREVAYDIEDVLDDYILSQRPKDVFKRIITFFKCLKTQHDFGTQLKDIKGRIQEISSRKDRYMLHTSSTIPTIRHDPREDALFLEEIHLVGIDGPRELLSEFLLEAVTRLSVISVFGEGGLGKTTIVKKVYDSPMVKSKFQRRAWIAVSQTFETKTLLRDLLKQLLPEVKVEEQMDAIRLKRLINDKLRKKRYIVVLDDIWSLDAWRELRSAFPDDSESGSRLMVTSRNVNIAQTCIEDCGHMYPHQPLSFEDSRKLLYRKALRTNVDDMSSFSEHFLKDLSEKILKKCKGLPLAIVAIGGILSLKQPSEWEQVYQGLGSLMDRSINPQLDDLHLVISFSYTDLPSALKPCFLYFSIFPEDYAIECDKLLRLWVAEGFIGRRPSTNLIMEEIAGLYLDELIQRSLVQVDEIGVGNRVKLCRIHDFMREFTIGKSLDQRFAAVVAQEEEELLFLSSDSIAVQRQPRRLSISNIQHEDIGKNILSANNKSLPHLRSLVLFSPPFRFKGLLADSSINKTRFSNFKLLRVLDLERAGLQKFPIEIVNLFYLKYLCLKKNRLRFVPNLVEKLIHIETIDLRSTLIHELPVGIIKLRHLRNLLLYCIRLPIGICNLVALENLGVVDVDVERSGLFISQLRMLTHLRKLAIRQLREEDGLKIISSVEKMKSLRSFKVSSKDNNSLRVNSPQSFPPPSLRSFTMKGPLDELPRWIASLRNLEKLQLGGSKLTKDPVEVLQTLPSLVFLKLYEHSFQGEELSFAKVGFPRLKKLLIISSDYLNKLKVEEGAMPVIDTIRFAFCPMLEELPLGFGYLTTLTHISLYQVGPCQELWHSDMSTKLYKRPGLVRFPCKIYDLIKPELLNT